MSVAALVIALLSLALALVAYWRSGGRRDLEAMRRELRRELEVLHTKQGEFTEGASRSLSAAYEANRRRLAVIGDDLRRLKDEAATGLEEQLRQAQEWVETLGRKVESAAIAARDSTVATAHEVEQALAQRVRELEARSALLRAKGKAIRAIRAAENRDFEQADRALQEATELLDAARAGLGGEDDEGLAEVRAALLGASAAVQARGSDIRARIDRAVADADRLMVRLEAAGSESARHAR